MGIRRSLVRKRSPELVWSGPEAGGLAGDTRDVYEELFSSAKGIVCRTTSSTVVYCLALSRVDALGPDSDRIRAHRSYGEQECTRPHPSPQPHPRPGSPLA